VKNYGAVLAFRNFPLQVVKRIKEPFDGLDWLFEIKHDGFRVLAICDGRGATRLFTRNGYDISRRHRHLTEPLDALPANRFVLDGELVVLDDDGRSNFGKLMFGRTGTHYFAFDLLMLDSTDLRPLPLESRKERLRELLQSSDDPVRYCDHVTDRGKDFFDLVRATGLEGMVAKRRRSSYLGRLTDDWLKIKCLRTHDFIVGGWLRGETDRDVRALLLGEFFGDVLRYLGAVQVQAGFGRHTWREIARGLIPQERSPFADTIPDRDARFCEPSRRVPIEFAEFTEDGHLRRSALSCFTEF
jgi:bifunctional non-homologous end joining protein LigD